jgi:hypothetical protein
LFGRLCAPSHFGNVGSRCVSCGTNHGTGCFSRCGYSGADGRDHGTHFLPDCRDSRTKCDGELLSYRRDTITNDFGTELFSDCCADFFSNRCQVCRTNVDTITNDFGTDRFFDCCADFFSDRCQVCFSYRRDTITNDFGTDLFSNRCQVCRTNVGTIYHRTDVSTDQTRNAGTQCGSTLTRNNILGAILTSILGSTNTYNATE